MLQIEQPNACALCERVDFDEIGYGNSDDIDIFCDRTAFVCVNCGLGKVAPPVAESDLADYYANQYRAAGTAQYIDYGSPLPPTATPRAVSQVLLGAQFLGDPKQINFLDIGPGLGHTFSVVDRLFPDCRLYGLEANPSANNYFRRHFENFRAMSQLTDLNEEIDLCINSHCLEHFNSEAIPGFLSMLIHGLRKGGVCVIEVPHDDLRDPHIVEAKAPHAPHLTFFSRESLRRTLDIPGCTLAFLNAVGPRGKRGSAVIARRTRRIRELIVPWLRRAGLYSRVRPLEFMLRGYDELRLVADANFRYSENGRWLRAVLVKDQGAR